jgi:hypothetical protein
MVAGSGMEIIVRGERRGGGNMRVGQSFLFTEPRSLRVASASEASFAPGAAGVSLSVFLVFEGRAERHAHHFDNKRSTRQP